MATSRTEGQSQRIVLNRWFVRLVLAGQMYAFLVVFLFVLTAEPWWRMLLWAVAGAGIQAGMLLLAWLTDPRRSIY